MSEMKANECPHKEIVAYTDYTEYHIFISKGWRCKWCYQLFEPKRADEGGKEKA